MLVQKKSENLI